VVGVALLGENPEHPRAVGADQRTRRYRRAGEIHQLFGAWRIGDPKAYPAQSKLPIYLCPKVFYRDHDRNLVR
jgi:hypothetical protein